MLAIQFQETAFANLFDIQSRQEIVAKLENERIRFLGNSVEQCFQDIAALPHYANRLAWNKITHICLHPPDNCLGSSAQRKINYGKQIYEFIWSLGKYFTILDQKGSLFEDHFSDCVLEMSFREFCDLGLEFFYTPGHKYLMGESLTWLLNITMEGDVYFSQKLKDLLK